MSVGTMPSPMADVMSGFPPSRGEDAYATPVQTQSSLPALTQSSSVLSTFDEDAHSLLLLRDLTPPSSIPVEAESPLGSKRTSSGVVKKERITELSSQLRTRLSYAMIKVQNGWQSHSLDQVESLHTAKRASQSPSEVKREGGEQTYESFWQNHTANPHTAKLHAARRRKPPPLPTSVSNVSTMSTLSTSTVPTEIDGPITPTRTTTFTMEQDAVESLMFLASPGHSQTTSRPTSRQQPYHAPRLIRNVLHVDNTDDEGDSLMEQEEDELDRELDADITKEKDYDEDDDDDEELMRYDRDRRDELPQVEVQQSRLKRVKTMEEVLGRAGRESVVA